MAVDTPARIAIVGAGPIGLEAALYARFLGYDVDIYERGRVCEHVWRRGHARLFAPWRDQVSPLGVAALEAQDAFWHPRPDHALLTGRELIEAYFQPLADSDLLADHMQLGVEVCGISRFESLKGDSPGQSVRGDADAFALLVRDRKGEERLAEADILFDCSGTLGTPNGLGVGGLPAEGEDAAAAHIERGLPDVLGADRAKYAGRRMLVAGAGHAAAATIVAIAELAQQAPGTHATWLVRRPAAASPAGPVRRIPGDPLPERDRLAAAANALAEKRGGPIESISGAWVRSLAPAEGSQVVVRFQGVEREPVTVDAVIAQVGHRPDHRIYEELQVRRSPWSDATCDVAGTDDLLSPTPSSLVQPEIDFYVLGAKSFGRDSRFSLTIGREQVRAVFTIVGDRPGLNLYATTPGL